MPRFQANFTTYPAILYAPAKVSFTDTSSVGTPINDEFTDVVDPDGNTVKLIGKTVDQFDTFNITKYEWEFGEGSISVEQNPEHVYNYTNLYPVKLTIYSDEIFDEILNTFIRVRNSTTQYVDVGSVAYAWLNQHMTAPHREALETSSGFKDLINSTSKMFDRMYEDIAEAVKLIDIRTVAPQFLEYFSDTLGHERFYSKKVGYSAQEENGLEVPFLEYDIFSRISDGTASDEEIEVFRRFIADTAKLFKQNGSEQAMEAFFKLYGFIVDIREMWTTNFGTTPIPGTVDNFFGKPVLDESLNNFSYRDIAVSGFQQDKGYIASNVSNLILDNYHYNSRHIFPSDVLNDGVCETTFEINEIPPNIIGVIRDDGRLITEKDNCSEFFTTICPIDPNERLCTEDEVRLGRNEEWSGISKLVFGTNAKIWRVRDNYVQSVINAIGTVPVDPDEAFEEPSDISDDYLWADWKNGITPAPEVPGVVPSQFRRPSDQLLLTNINLSTTQEDSDIISRELTNIDTSRDTYVVMRGFIKIDIRGYYNFFMDVGNPGNSNGENHVGLFSLKHTKTYTEDDVNEFESLDLMTFPRSNDEIEYTVTNGGESKKIYGRQSEYGVVELRQDESVDDGYQVYSQDAGFYNLDKGYYAYEIKGTYNTFKNKKLQLSWQIWDEVERPSGTFFEVIQSKTVIPASSLLTFDESEKSIEDTLGKGIMTIPHELLEGSDSLKVVYFNTHEGSNNLSGFISRDGMVKDGEFCVRLSPSAVTTAETAINVKQPQKAFGIIFRGTNKERDLYANVDTYYAFIFNGLFGEYGIAQISYEEEIDDVFFRYLNLNPNSTDLDKREFFKNVTDEFDHIVELEEDVYYDFRVVVENNKVSAYYRENTEFTTAFESIRTSVAIDLTEYDSTVDEWVTLIENVDLLQDDVQTETFDYDKSIIDIPQKYSPTDEPGTYGLFVLDSAFRISRFAANPYDTVDYNRLVTEDKWKEIKPKYLDSRSSDTLQYNSYGVTGVDKPVNPTFKVKIVDDYQGENSEVLPEYLGLINDNLVNRVFADGVDASDMGSRLNIFFDAEYINERFNTTEEAIDAICVPYGRFYEPFIEWSPVQGSFTSIPYAGFSQLISENAKVYPHTVASLIDDDGSIDREYISTLTRDTDDETILVWDTILNTFVQATGEGSYAGVWEEVAPHSADEIFDVPTLGSVSNELFEIIKQGSTPIGVKIKSMDVFERLECRFCQGAVLWGLYDITFPDGAITNLPEYLKTLDGIQLEDLDLEEFSEMQIECVPPEGTIDQHPFEDACDDSGLTGNTIRYFLPIGKLDKDYMIFVPPAALLENGRVSVNLLGVYSHLDMDKFTFADSDTNVQLKINDINDYEEKYKSKVQCKYFLDFENSFVAKITNYNDTTLHENVPDQCDPGDYLFRNADDKRDQNGCGDFISNAYFIPDMIRKIVDYLEGEYPVSDNKQIDSQFFDDFNWWMPNSIWMKRKFTPLYPENKDTHLFTGFSDVGGTFYGQEITTGGINISIDDNIGGDEGIYQFEGDWCVSSVGWDSDYFTVANVSGQKFETVDIGEHIIAPIPLQTIDMSGVNSLEFGNYYNDETVGKRTFSPPGTFNWLQTHSNGVSGSEMVGWEVSDWNDEFAKCVRIKNVFSRVDSAVYDLNKYWGFFQEQIPPVASQVNIIYNNRNCYSVDGENTPKSVTYDISLGISDGYIGFYAVPPLVQRYGDWLTKVDSVYIDNYTISPDEYFITRNTEIPETGRSQFNLRTDMFSFNKFLGSNMFLDFFFDKLFDLQDSTNLTDDFGANRDINWLTYVDNTKYYQIGKRSVDAELKFTGESLPYNIKSYRNSNVYQAVDKFDVEQIDTISGTTDSEKRDKTIVGFENNRGFRNIMSLTDVESNNYSLACDFIFDRDIVNTTGERNFELIIKAENNYVVEDRGWGITDFYYVGTGTNGFDIGLGMRSLDQSTGEFQDTFLASFGDFNLRNIRSDVWYTLRADVSNENIKIFFNERGSDSRLVLNYNINKKYEKLTERYLKGEFETLQSVIIGLEELGITYPNTLSNKVSEDYTFDNFKEEFAGTLPIEGQYCGFRVFNDLTYVSEVRYEAFLPKKYTWGNTYDGVGFNTVLYKIINRFNVPSSAEIVGIDQGLDGTTFIQIDNELFFHKEGNDPEKYKNLVYDFKVVHDKIIIVEQEALADSAIGLNNWAPGQHTFTWVLAPTENSYKANLYSELITTIPNATGISIKRTSVSGNVISREISYDSTTGDISGSDSIIAVGDEVTVTIGGDRNINWPLDGEWALFDLFVRAFQEGFTKEYPILIKDKTFYTDNLKKYLNMADKRIRNVYINDSMLHLVFEDN